MGKSSTIHLFDFKLCTEKNMHTHIFGNILSVMLFQTFCIYE